MPTGLKKAHIGNINIQPNHTSLSNETLVGITDAIAVDGKIVSSKFKNTIGGNIAPLKSKLNNSLSSIPFINLPDELPDNGTNNKIHLSTNIDLNAILSKIGIYNLRPEILSLIDFKPIYNGTTKNFNDVGEFINIVIAGRKIRFENIRNLFDSLFQIEDARKSIELIGEEYISHIEDAEEQISLLTSLVQVVASIKNVLNIRIADNVADRISDGEDITVKSYRDILIDYYQFTDGGYNNFSNTKILGQFLSDIKDTLKQYSPLLFGGDQSSSNSQNKMSPGFGFGQPTDNDVFLNNLFAAGESSTQLVSRNADRTFGKYQTRNLDITNGEFLFQIRLFEDQSIPLVGPQYFKFLELLPSSLDDRILLMTITLSKELRISKGLSNKNVDKILTDVGASANTDPFDFIIGIPGESITDLPNADESLCSLLRYERSGKVILPFETDYVEDQSKRTYIPGTADIADYVLTANEPFNLSHFKQFRDKLNKRGKDCILAVRKLLDVGSSISKLSSTKLYNEIIADIAEIANKAAGGLPRNNTRPFEPLSNRWVELGLFRLADTNENVKHLIFQLIIVLGLIGKSSLTNQAASIDDFYRVLGTEIKTWGDLPALRLSTALSSDLISFLESRNAPTTLSQIFNKPTSDVLSGYTVQYFIAQAIANEIKQNAPKILPVVNSGIIEYNNFIATLVSNSVIELLFKVVDFASSLHSRSDDYLHSNKTKLSRIAPTSILAFSFELYLSIFNTFFGFVGESIYSKSYNDNDNNILMSFEFAKFRHTVQSLIYGFYPPAVQTDRGLFADGNETINKMISLRSKFIIEERIVKEIIERLDKTIENVDIVYDNALEFISSNKSKLNDIIDSVDGKEKISLLSEGQIRLFRNAINEFKKGSGLTILNKKETVINPDYYGHTARENSRRARVAPPVRIVDKQFPIFVDSTVLSTDELKLIYDKLGENKYRSGAADNLKIMSVGIPTGFIDKMNNLISLGDVRTSRINNKERDVISINVYRKSIDFEDLVFKPISYIFELSRFVSKSTINQAGTSQRSDSRPAQQGITYTIDYSKGEKADLTYLRAFLEDEKYSFLSDERKKQLLNNHLESYILEEYIKLLTGISTSELDYYISENIMLGEVVDSDVEKFKDLLLLYIRGLTGQSLTLEQLKASSPQITQLLNKIDDFKNKNGFVEQIQPPQLNGVSKSAAIALTEDLFNFIKIFNPNSFIVGGKTQARKMMSPKIFDRIFNIAIDPDDFLIDVDKTNETTAGKKMYKSLLTKGLIIPDRKNKGYKIKERDVKKNIFTEQYFINISVINALS